MKAESEGSVQREPRTCPVCGTKFFATVSRQPWDTDTPQVRRFENYEVALDEAGRPIELGRGAMGVTYKASTLVCDAP